MEPGAADFPVFEIAADDAGFRQVSRMIGEPRWIDREAAFEIRGDRQVHALDDPAGAIEIEVERDFFAVAIAVGLGDRIAAGGERRGTSLGHGLGAGHVPDVVQQHRIARLMQLAETIP